LASPRLAGKNSLSNPGAEMRTARWSAGICFIAFAAPATPAAAQVCGPLKIVASVDLEAAPNDAAVFVPVSLQQQTKYLLLDTGGTISELMPAAVSELGLASVKTPTLRFYDVRGNYVDHHTIVPDFAIGGLTGHNVDFVVGPNDLFRDSSNVAGILGPGILRYYDVALDIAGKKLTLLSQDHCDGKVVYWKANSVAVVLMQVAKASGHIVVPVTLDGQTLSANLDTGASRSTLNLSVAEGDFHLNEKQPDMIPVGRMRDKDDSIVFRHAFKSLSFEGLTITNPSLDIIPDLERGQMERPPATGTRMPDSSVEQKLPDLLIGMDILRHLHLYIAYKEQKLYITPASAPATTEASSPASAAVPLKDTVALHQ
jgi:Aspartyl protease